MSEQDSLWPKDLLAVIPEIPTDVVKRQAEHLGKITKNIVEAKVSTWSGSDGDFQIQFILTCPPLRGYEYVLFELTHGPELYPVSVTDSSDSLKDEDALLDFLRRTFSSTKTVKVVRAIAAQARAITGRGEDPGYFDDDVPF